MEKLYQKVIISEKECDHQNLISVFYVANRYTIHAEQDCIRKCPKKIISKCTMILVKITHLDNVAPCEMCAKLISKYKIKRIYCYSCDEKDYK